MAKSGRSLLAEEGDLEVKILQVEQISPKLAVVSFIRNRTRYDDLYNVPKKTVMRDILMVASKRKHVTAVLCGDESDDLDSHPSVESAKVL